MNINCIESRPPFFTAGRSYRVVEDGKNSSSYMVIDDEGNEHEITIECLNQLFTRFIPQPRFKFGDMVKTNHYVKRIVFEVDHIISKNGTFCYFYTDGCYVEEDNLDLYINDTPEKKLYAYIQKPTGQIIFRNSLRDRVLNMTPSGKPVNITHLVERAPEYDIEYNPEEEKRA